MRKYHAPNCRRRPDLDPLENRHLLSGGIQFEVIEVHPAPALILGVDFREAAQSVDVFGSPPISPVSTVPGNWPMPGFHHDSTTWGEFPGPVVDVHAYADFQSAPLPTPPFSEQDSPPATEQAGSPTSEQENVALSTPGSESMASENMVSENMAAVFGPASHGDPAFSYQPPPGQPGFFMMPMGDPGRFLHVAVSLPTKAMPDDTILGSVDDTLEANDVGVTTSGNQSAVLSQGANSSGQIQPAVAATAGHLTALFNSILGRDDQSFRVARSDEASGNLPVETASRNLPRSGSASQVTTEGSLADGADHRGDDISSNAADPPMNASQTKLLLPQAAGLIANAVPFDQAALEKAVDQFFDKLEDLGVGGLVEHGSTRVIPLSLAVLSTVTAVEVARRRLKSRSGQRRATEGQSSLGSEELLGFPELPGSWSTNLT